MLTGCQIRDARRLLGLQAQHVAGAAGVSTAVVLLAEIGDDEPSASSAQVEAIRFALEAVGVEFIAENGSGAGGRLRKAEQKDVGA